MKKNHTMPPGCKTPPTLTTTPAPAQRERYLTFRVSWSDLDALKVAAREQGTTVSELLRLHLPGRK